jgi:hypothetical protein
VDLRTSAKKEDRALFPPQNNSSFHAASENPIHLPSPPVNDLLFLPAVVRPTGKWGTGAAVDGGHGLGVMVESVGRQLPRLALQRVVPLRW